MEEVLESCCCAFECDAQTAKSVWQGDVVRRSSASVQQSGHSPDLEPELVSLASYLLCVLRRVAEKALY